VNAELMLRVYKTWAEHFHLSLECFAAPGTTLYVNEKRSATSSIVLWPVGERIVVEVAPAWHNRVAQLVAQFPEEHRLSLVDFQSVWGAVEYSRMPLYAVDPALFRPFAPPSPFTVRQLTVDDQPAFDDFLAQCSEDERDEGDVSIDHLLAFGAFDGSRIVGASSVFVWRGFMEPGILTDPAYRGKGLGKALVSACAEYYLGGERVVSYRHDIVNVGSQRIADSLGFSRYGIADMVEPPRV
jgi:RimJ/RimL family protein N-acetyltransferase